MSKLRQLKLFLAFNPSIQSAPQLGDTDKRAIEEFFKSSAGRKLDALVDIYVTQCALGACGQYGDEGSYRNGWAMGAHGLRSFIKSNFRQPSTHEGTDIEDDSGIPDDLQ